MTLNIQILKQHGGELRKDDGDRDIIAFGSLEINQEIVNLLSSQKNIWCYLLLL